MYFFKNGGYDEKVDSVRIFNCSIYMSCIC